MMYIAMRPDDFYLTADGQYNADGKPVAVGESVDDLKHACYLSLVIPSLRDQFHDMESVDCQWRLCPKTTDCYICLDGYKHVLFAIYPIEVIVPSQETQVQS